MSTLTAVTWVAAFLLVLAGAGKVKRPAATGSALRTARLPSDRRLVRLLGIGEVALGLAVLAVGGTVPTALLAGAYGAFAVFAQRQRRDGSDCGCFGATGTPVTGTPVTAAHVWVNTVFACVAVGAAITPASELTTLVSQQPIAAFAVAVLIVVATNLVRLLLTAAPDLSAAVVLLEPDTTS
ncbi:hypothetical protein BH23ACT10_BH23ACT10_27820 [soil metagenome]